MIFYALIAQSVKRNELYVKVILCKDQKVIDNCPAPLHANSWRYPFVGSVRDASLRTRPVARLKDDTTP